MEKFMLGVYYRDIKLGVLTFEKGVYIYKAIPNNVARAHQKGYVTRVYGCDEDFVSKDLPMAIEEFIPPEEIVEPIQPTPEPPAKVEGNTPPTFTWISASSSFTASLT